MKRFQFLEHPSDLKIQACGKDGSELFVNMAKGMMCFLYGKPRKISSLVSDKIYVQAQDRESLMVNWLSELLAFSDCHHCYIAEYRIHRWSDCELEAEIFSIPKKAKTEIKAVTYNELVIQETKKYWTSTVVFDL